MRGRFIALLGVTAQIVVQEVLQRRLCAAAEPPLKEGMAGRNDRSRTMPPARDVRARDVRMKVAVERRDT